MNKQDKKTEISHIEKQFNNVYKNFTTDSIYAIIEMFPYPSGNIHVGHVRNYVIGDVIYRYYRMLKGACIRVIGWDSFGLPAENAARENNIHAKKWTEKNISQMREQLQGISLLYDWSREISTSEYSYFKYTQEIFIMFFNAGIIFQDYYFVNWDPVDKTVLSNEQVIDGKGWRSNETVELRLIKSWFFDLKKYAKYMYDNLSELKWPKKILAIQKNWIGIHSGSVIRFPIVINNEKTNTYIDCFTRAPEEYPNVSSIWISPNHKIAREYLLNKNLSITYSEFQKLFIETNIFVYNKLSNKNIPVYICAEVSDKIGTGAKMLTPNSYEEDRIFAEKYGVKPLDQEKYEIVTYEFLLENNLVYQDSFSKLNHWCISRQRCWGCPIPLYYCDECKKYYPYQNKKIDETRLSYQNYTDLEKAEINIECKHCKSNACVVKETLDTFFDSSWYFLKYLTDSKKEFNIKDALKLLPIKKYIGGIEHANLHLLYTRAVIRALIELTNTEDKIPFETIINQGLIHMMSYKDKNNKYISYTKYRELLEKNENPIKYKIEKMSKSKKNIIDPQEIIEQYSASALRVMILSNYPIEYCYEWDHQLIDRCQSFVNKILDLLKLFSEKILSQKSIIDAETLLTKQDHEKLKKFYEEIFYAYQMLEENKLNNYIAALHILFKSVKMLYHNDDNQKNNVIFNYILQQTLYVFYPLLPSITDYIYYLTYQKTITEREKINLLHNKNE